jgi:predicted nuclease with TOPRIM domain
MPKSSNPGIDVMSLSQFGQSIDAVIRAERRDFDAALEQNQNQFEQLDSRLEILGAELSSLAAPMENFNSQLSFLTEALALQKEEFYKEVLARDAMKSAAEAVETTLLAQLEVINRELASHRDSFINQLDVAKKQTEDRLIAAEALLAEVNGKLAELYKEQVTLARENGRLQGELASQRENFSGQLHSAEQEASSRVQAIEVEMAQIRNQVDLREQQLQQAKRLLIGMPDPLAGLSGLRAVLVRRLLGKTRLTHITSHQSTVAHWQLYNTAASDLNDLDFLGSLNEGKFQSLVSSFENREWVMVEDKEPVTNVPMLLARQDRHFVRTAYQALLGRAPDPEGEAYYLARLRAGEHKLVILKQLRQSEEGRAFVPGVAGLDRAIKRHSLANLPLIGAVLAPLIGAERDTRMAVALRKIENNLSAQIAQSSVPMSTELKGALDWIDTRIGRLLEISEDLWSEKQGKQAPSFRNANSADQFERAPSPLTTFEQAVPSESVKPETTLGMLKDSSGSRTPESIRLAIVSELNARGEA